MGSKINHLYLGKTGLGAVGGSPVGVGENGRDVYGAVLAADLRPPL